MRDDEDALPRLLRGHFGGTPPPCDAKTQAWIREMFGTGSGLSAAKARALRRDNIRRHAKWMARNDPV